MVAEELQVVLAELKLHGELQVDLQGAAQVRPPRTHKLQAGSGLVSRCTRSQPAPVLRETQLAQSQQLACSKLT